MKKIILILLSVLIASAMKGQISNRFTYITTIGTSRAYSSNIVKTNTLFLIVNVLFYTMLGDAERSIHSLNGDITGTIYKGKAVEEVEH